MAEKGELARAETGSTVSGTWCENSFDQHWCYAAHIREHPQHYTAPWTATGYLRLLPDTELLESICENEQATRDCDLTLAGGAAGVISRPEIRMLIDQGWGMIAIDTNILVYAHGRDSEWHEKAPLFVGGSESRHGNGKAGLIRACSTD